MTGVIHVLDVRDCHMQQLSHGDHREMPRTPVLHPLRGHPFERPGSDNLYIAAQSSHDCGQVKS